MNIYLRVLIGLVLYTLLQLFVFESLVLFGTSVPKIYLVFLLMLPFQLSNPVLYITAFLIGLFIDLGLAQPGFRAFSCTLIIALREFWLDLINPIFSSNWRNELDISRQPIGWILIYLLPLTAIFEMVFIFLFDFGLSIQTITKFVINFCYTSLCCLIIFVLFYQKN
jgi:hypothetical protein